MGDEDYKRSLEGLQQKLVAFMQSTASFDALFAQVAHSHARVLS